MQLTPTELTKVAELHAEYLSVTNQITNIGKAIHQVVEDDCTIDFTFKMHNKTVHEENASKKETDWFKSVGLINKNDIIDLWVATERNNAHGINKSEPILNSCRTEIIYTLTTTAAVRTLNILLAEKEEHRKLIQQQIEDILRPTITLIQLTTIQHLHEPGRNTQH